MDAEAIFLCISFNIHHIKNVKTKVVQQDKIYILCHVQILWYDEPFLRTQKYKVNMNWNRFSLCYIRMTEVASASLTLSYCTEYKANSLLQAAHLEWCDISLLQDA
jgi:hypothetical protein